jgi:3-phosphoshikimate 1-carboxyvinyltransferase
MTIRVNPHRFSGVVKVPPSKSHTIRQLLIASLSDGVSEIINPLDSLDTRSCLSVCRVFGAEITEHKKDDLLVWKIKGNNNFKNNYNSPVFSESAESAAKRLSVNIGNSGTTLFFALALAGLQSEWIEFTGDSQIQNRSAAPLLDALSCFGVQQRSSNGHTPIMVKGLWKGGTAILPCPTSQYLSALLISAPLAPSGIITEIEVPFLNEKPYVEMTISYLKAQKVTVTVKKFGNSLCFRIPGGSGYKAFSSNVPADFSSAAFSAAAAAITGGPVTLLGLNLQDTQGDKYFFEILKKMGCKCQAKSPKKAFFAKKPDAITIYREGFLKGGVFDLNDTPDLLPAAAVVAAYAKGDTIFTNVANARIKETDRIAVLRQELAKFGVCCTELPDELIVHGKGGLNGLTSPVSIDGHGDHRIVMAFAVAALGSPVPVEISTAECTATSYPAFFEMVSEKNDKFDNRLVRQLG